MWDGPGDVVAKVRSGFASKTILESDFAAWQLVLLQRSGAGALAVVEQFCSQLIDRRAKHGQMADDKNLLYRMYLRHAKAKKTQVAETCQQGDVEAA